MKKIVFLAAMSASLFMMSCNSCDNRQQGIVLETETDSIFMPNDSTVADLQTFAGWVHQNRNRSGFMGRAPERGRPLESNRQFRNGDSDRFYCRAVGNICGQFGLDRLCRTVALLPCPQTSTAAGGRSFMRSCRTFLPSHHPPAPWPFLRLSPH